MVRHYCPAELGDIVIEVNQILGLLVSLNIVEVNVLVAPFKIMNYSFVSQLLLDYEDILEEINYSLLNIKMVEFCYHSFLAFQVSLISIDHCIPFINDTSYIVEYRGVCGSFK